jgi:hypothetical protein
VSLKQSYLFDIIVHKFSDVLADPNRHQRTEEDPIDVIVVRLSAAQPMRAHQ